MFSIRIHHGGRFHKYPGIRYVDGHVNIFDMVDIDLFTVITLNMMVVQLGYTGESEPLFYNYLRPLTSLDERLYSLACEEDIHCLATLVRSFKLIEVYIEHDVTAVDSDRRPTRVRATIEDITDEPSSIAAIEHKSRKMLLLTWHDSSEPTKELVYDSVTPSQVIEDVMRQLSFDETELDGEACFGDVVGSDIERFGLSHDESFGVEDLDLNLTEPVDLNVSQIETQAQLPVSEEPDVGRTQEPIMEEGNGQEDVKQDDDADEDDDDILVDEENKIIEPDVGVHLFGISMNVLFHNIGVTNLVPDDVLEGKNVDVINADGFNSTNNDSQACSSGLDAHDKGDLCPWVLINMKIPVKAVQNQLQRDLELQISMSKAFRAKAKAEREIRGDHILRDLLGLDGAFKKRTFPGQVLTAVGHDLNNGIYPLAYALVEGESRAQSDLLLNNIYKVFNGKIVGGRDKPMITLLEYNREYYMKRIVNVQSIIDKCTSPLTPITTRIMESIKKEAHLMKVQWNGGYKYQVSGDTTPRSVGKSFLLVDYIEENILSQGGNNTKASGSASRQTQQAKPAVGQDSSGASSVGAVIDRREMGDGIPTQSSSAGGASEWSFM
ncbi:hypothetical protein Tco_0046486 [Tanacetum coccineum]